MNFNYSYSG